MTALADNPNLAIPATNTPTVASRLKTWNSRRRQIAQTRKELNALSDHELADIGIRRSMINEISRSV